MIRYSRYVEPDAPQQRTVPKSSSPKPRTIVVPQVQAATEPAPRTLDTNITPPTDATLLPGVEQLELTAPDNPPAKARKSRPVICKSKTQTADSSTAPALPLLTAFEV